MPPEPKQGYLGTKSEIISCIEEYVRAEVAAGRNPNVNNAIKYVLSVERFPAADPDRVRRIYTAKVRQKRGSPTMATIVLEY